MVKKGPIKIFHNSSSSNDNGSKIDTSFIVNIPFLRTVYTESNSGEDIDMKKELANKNLKDPINTTEAASKHYADNLLNNPNIKNH